MLGDDTGQPRMLSFLGGSGWGNIKEALMTRAWTLRYISAPSWTTSLTPVTSPAPAPQTR